MPVSAGPSDVISFLGRFGGWGPADLMGCRQRQVRVDPEGFGIRIAWHASARGSYGSSTLCASDTLVCAEKL